MHALSSPPPSPHPVQGVRVLRGLCTAVAFTATTIGLVAIALAALGPPPAFNVASKALTSGKKARSDDGIQGDTAQRVPLPGGTFMMGKNHACRPDESPAHDVTLAPFRIDAHEVTNARFARFVDATGYITTAEQQGWGLVLNTTTGEWQSVAGADWQHPRGPQSTVVGRERHPVVQVSWHDAAAYADWSGGRLPTEAEWEYAARAGLADADYPWGASEQTDGAYRANYFQGWFPATDSARDGFAGLAPVGGFAPAANGTYDMAGNAAEWCSDQYAADFYARSPHGDPTGPTQTRHRAEPAERVVRGGSWCSPEGYCPAYRVTSRAAAPPDTCRDDLGFRCAYDAE
ncbi:MAG: formylglycine-generating enzyme family protein [Planctomycetales bacterium]|nr:formylglycine-generating enzyme family protein [Planctomycetales bacterium]